MTDCDMNKGWMPLTPGHMPDLIRKQLHAPSFDGTDLRAWAVEQSSAKLAWLSVFWAALMMNLHARSDGGHFSSRTATLSFAGVQFCSRRCMVR